jgi:hypothetical protein
MRQPPKMVTPLGRREPSADPGEGLWWPVTHRRLDRGHGRSVDHRPHAGCSALVGAGETHDVRRDRQHLWSELYAVEIKVSSWRQPEDLTPPNPVHRETVPAVRRGFPPLRLRIGYLDLQRRGFSPVMGLRCAQRAHESR